MRDFDDDDDDDDDDDGRSSPGVVFSQDKIDTPDHTLKSAPVDMKLVKYIVSLVSRPSFLAVLDVLHHR